MGEFNKISEILDEQVFNKNACLASVKKAVAFGFWKNITGPKFAKFSKPYDIKGKTLLVAVKNPAVMQELIFYKATLLEKIKNDDLYNIALTMSDYASESIRADNKNEYILYDLNLKINDFIQQFSQIARTKNLNPGNYY